MKRYEEEDGQEEGFFQDEPQDEQQEIEAVIDMGAVIEADLHEQSLNQELLLTAIHIAKQDIWWFFRSPATKIRRIERIYRRLSALVRESFTEGGE
jgi:hypothetical protein